MVQLGVLGGGGVGGGEGLGKCCSADCCKTLDLQKTASEKRFGLGSVLWVECDCGELNRVPTGTGYMEKKKGVPIYEQLTKDGMLYAGLSQVGVNRFLSYLFLIRNH